MREDSTACELYQIVAYSISECSDCNPEELSSKRCIKCYRTHLGVMKEDGDIRQAAYDVFRYSPPILSEVSGILELGNVWIFLFS